MKTLCSTTLFLFFFSLLANAGTTDCPTCDEVATLAAKADTPNKVLEAYASYHKAQMSFYEGWPAKFTKSGEVPGIDPKLVNNVKNRVSNALKKMNNKIQQIRKTNYTSRTQYEAELKSIHQLGHKEITGITNLIGINTVKEIQRQSDDTFLAGNCYEQGQTVRKGCLDALQKMSDCGIYTVLGLQALRDDQENCANKGNAFMEVCIRTGGATDAYQESTTQMLEAEMACAEHQKLASGNAPAQYQSWY